MFRNSAFFVFIWLAPFNVMVAEIVFEGVPRVKMEVREGFTSSRSLSPDQANEAAVRISSDGMQYFWASHGNIPLVKTESEDFVTYVAITGNGYIRILSKALRQGYESLPQIRRAKLGYLYVEHQTHGMGAHVFFGE